MTGWPMVGRAGELARARAALADFTWRGVVFRGASGTGKTLLLRALTAGHDESCHVVPVYATSALAEVAFGAFHAFLPSPDLGLDPAGVIGHVLSRITADEPGRTVLAVDDLHLLDELSAALVLQAVMAGTTTLVATVTDGGDPPEAVGRLLRGDVVAAIHVGALSPAHVWQLLTEVLGGPVEESSATRIHELTSGNPLAIRQIVDPVGGIRPFTLDRGLWRYSSRTDDLLLAAPGRLVERRIGGLAPDVREAVELVALGEPVELDTLIRLAGQHAVEAAEEEGLIRVVLDGRRRHCRMGHPLYREVVLGRLASRVRRHRHLRELANAIRGHGLHRIGDPLRVGRWLLEVGDAPEPWLFTEAARRAYAGFDFPLAARLATAALAGGAGMDAVEILTLVHGLSGEPDHALDMLDRIQDRLATDSDRARWATTRAMVEFGARDDPLAAGRLQTAADRLASDPTGLMRPMAAVLDLFCGAFSDAGVRLRQAAADLTSPVAASTFAAAWATGLDLYEGAGESALTRLSSLQNDTATAWRGQHAFLRPSLDFAQRMAHKLTGHAENAPADTHLTVGAYPLLDVQLSLAAAAARRLAGAAGTAFSAAAQARLHANVAGGAFRSECAAEVAQLAALLGRHEDARRALAEADTAHGPTMRLMYPWLELARAQVHASEGDQEGAGLVLDRLLDAVRADRFLGIELLALHAQVRYQISDDGTVRALDRLSAIPGRLPQAVRDHATGVAAEDAAVILRAADAYGDLGLRLYAAEATADAVRLLQRQRATGLGRASDRLAGLLTGMDAWHTPALRLSMPSLSQRDRTVLHHAADGRTSQAIAKMLRYSPRTIEGILTGWYPRLGLATRAELPGFVRLLQVYDRGLSLTQGSETRGESATTR